MRFYLKNRTGSIDASAEYDEKEKTFTVLKGSRISEKVSNARTFRSIKTILSLRSKYVTEGVVVKMDVSFKSPSSAANFVRGTSTDGCLAWKNENGQTFKELFGGK